MPTFPKYRGELPQCLNPGNIRHYFLLAYWVYFRPTALHCYFYQASPEFYRSEKRELRKTWIIPAYRNLYLMIIPVVLFSFMLLIGLTIFLSLLTIWQSSLNLVFLSLIKIMLLGIAGIFILVYSAIFISIYELIFFGEKKEQILTYFSISIFTGVISSIIIILTVLFLKIENLILFFIMQIFLFIFVLIFQRRTKILVAWLLLQLFIFSLDMIGQWMNLAGEKLEINYNFNSIKPESSQTSFLFLSAFLFLFLWFGASWPILFLYPIQFLLSLYSKFRSNIHPILWNEGNILPLPNTQRLLVQRLKQDEATGLELIIEVSRNPWQRHAAQKALQHYLHTHPAPLRLLYKLLTDHEMDAYVAIPKSKKDWEKLPIIGDLLIGELCGYYNFWGQNSFALIFTQFRRDRRKTSLTQLASWLNYLLQLFYYDNQLVGRETFPRDLEHYPGGEEIANSFSAMRFFNYYDTLFSLPEATDIVKQHNYATLLTLENAVIRPTVLTALIRLGEVGAEIATYQDATSKVNKQASLLRANDTLEKLEGYVVDKVFPPEQAILEQIIEKWRKLVSKAGGEIGRATEAEPVANPYVLGNPVTGFLFVGREDIMRRLEELWMPEQRPSVVIYGHRRMGKTSILQNLGARFGSKTAIVDFNMQRIGLVKSTEDLLYRLSVKLYDSLSADQQAQLGEPAKENFAQDPYFALDRFLQQLDSIKLGKRFIITIDEFEKIEEGIKEKRLEPELLDFWRGLIQTYPWFVMAFAGLHTLREMTEDYWNPLYGSVTAIPVSFLTPKAAERLIVQPTPDFDLDYDLDTVEQIINLTNGQPYLVQLIGHTLVTRFNRQTFEEGIERKRRFTVEDVEAIINTKEFYLAGNAYFQGVWKQAEKGKPVGQTTILEILSQASLSLSEIANQTDLNLDQVQSALDTLQRHDVITQRDGRYVYTVELMRRWVAQRK